MRRANLQAHHRGSQTKGATPAQVGDGLGPNSDDHGLGVYVISFAWLLSNGEGSDQSHLIAAQIHQLTVPQMRFNQVAYTTP